MPEGEALAVAVSGGADSFALLHACAEKGLPVIALTVDHGLRAGSAEEARTVAAWCRGRGIPQETLRWEDVKPETGIQAAARQARYRLLAQACTRLGLPRLATGHTADDQAETVFMRLRRGSGRGLAGMASEQLIACGPGAPVRLVRPLLGVRREETRAHAEAYGLPVADDPSNEDDRFERVRVRALLAALEQQDILTVDALCRSAIGVGRLQDEADIGQYWHESDYDTDFLEDGSISAFDQNWIAGYADAGPHADAFRRHAEAFLHRVIATLGENASEASGDVSVLLAEGKAVVGGVVVVMRTGSLSAFREPAALMGRADGFPGLLPVPAPPGSKHLFDRRFIVEVPEDAAPGTELVALGRLLPRDIVLSTVSRQRIATLPCLARGVRPTHLPAASIRAIHHALAGWKRGGEFLPSSSNTFAAYSLLAERFAGNVIRY